MLPARCIPGGGPDLRHESVRPIEAHGHRCFFLERSDASMKIAMQRSAAPIRETTMIPSVASSSSLPDRYCFTAWIKRARLMTIRVKNKSPFVSDSNERYITISL